MPIAYIAFGSNLGDRNKNIQNAIELLRARPNIQIKRISSVIETKPEGGIPQRNFLNGVLEIETDLPPERLLAELQKIEKSLKRKRTIKNGPRTIDLDILFYGSRIVKMPGLIIPHPRLHKRRFVLGPLCEIAPDFIHPILKKKIEYIEIQ